MKQKFDYRALGLMVATLLLALAVFNKVMDADRVLFMTDNNIGYTSQSKMGLPSTFLGGIWLGGPLLGSADSMQICLENVFKWVMPLRAYVNWFHAVMLGIASMGMAWFCLSRKCSALSVFLGLVVAFWLGSDLTLTYSGHNGKYGVLAFAGLALALIEMAAARKRMAWCLLAGYAVGRMFIEQQDVALFIGLFLGAYAIYAILRENRGQWRSLVAPLLLIGVASLLVGGPNVLSGYMTQVKGVVAMRDENPEQKWEYCTQWSLPPEDMLEFVAPGFRGIRSGDPEGPYWGRQGRSAGWEQTHQGFPNFKLESVYVGIVPIVLACLALMTAFWGRRGQNSEIRSQKSGVKSQKAEGRGQESGVRSQEPSSLDSEEAGVLGQRRGDILFWSAVTVIALLLSLGKFFPLYSVFYHIPGMASIRNPNKFLHVFQIGLGILTAFGADQLLRGLPSASLKGAKGFAYATLGLAGVLLLWAAHVSQSRDELINGFVSQGWSSYAPVMAGRMSQGALHAAIMASVIGVGVLLLVLWHSRARAWRGGVVLVLALVMVGDVLLLSKDYIKVVKMQDLVGDNAVTNYLKSNLNQQRVYMLSQEGFYNNWLTVLFPYHGIETFNVAQMPRMPEDYDRWLKTVGKDPVRLWQLSAVGYMLAPDKVWRQIQKDPHFSPHFEPVKGFNIVPSGEGIGVAEVPGDAPAQNRILRFKDGLPRVQLFHDWAKVSDEAVGQQLLDRSFNPHAKVLLAPDSAISPPPASPATGGESASAVLSATAVKVNTVVASPAVLLFVNKYADEWGVTVDGKPAPLLRCNSLCLGVYLEPGTHDVRFALRNQWGLFGTQAAGMLVCVAAAGSLLLRRRKAE